MTRRPINGGIVPLPPAGDRPPATARGALTNTDRLAIWWHRVRGHESAYSMNGHLWLCSCGSKIGRWSVEL